MKLIADTLVSERSVRRLGISPLALANALHLPDGTSFVGPVQYEMERGIFVFLVRNGGFVAVGEGQVTPEVGVTLRTRHVESGPHDEIISSEFTE